MTTTFSIIAQSLLAGFRSLIPIILVVSFFQLLVLQQPFPDLLQLLLGLSRAPAVDNGKLLGIVSYTDMVLRGMLGNDEI